VQKHHEQISWTFECGQWYMYVTEGLGKGVTSSFAARLPATLTSPAAESLEFAADLPIAPAGDDEALIARVCGSDKEALACLFRRYARLVRGVALRILRDASEADDLLQEVFLFIHRKAAIFDSSKSSARSWIVQMTYHRAAVISSHVTSTHMRSLMGRPSYSTRARKPRMPTPSVPRWSEIRPSKRFLAPSTKISAIL
jgi:hypothetical protein